MATNSSVQAEDRRAQILAIINREGTGLLEDLAKVVDVSSMTIRRDLDDLEREGLVRRVRGGAIAIDTPRLFGERRAVNSRAKQVIASKAAQLVPDSGAIAFDASSTIAALAPMLQDRVGLTVATNSYETFSQFNSAPLLNAVLIGGQQDPATGSFVGKIACESTQSMLYKRFFTSASALHSVHGSSESSLAETQVKHAFAQNSHRLVLCLDSTKLESTAISATFKIADVDYLITELDPSDPRLDPYRDLTEVL